MDIMNWIFFGPAKLVALSAWLVAGVGIAFIAAEVALMFLTRGHVQSRADFFRLPGILCGLLWLIFLGYELQMGAAFANSPTGATKPLRWDLLVLTPILIGMSVLACYSIAPRIHKSRSK